LPRVRIHVLAIGGSDPSGGAGIQADLKTIHALGGWGFTVVSAITAQNSRGVAAAHPIDPSDVTAQIGALIADFEIAAVKTGMLARAPIVECVAAALASDALADRPVVVDPVFRASDGTSLLDAKGVRALTKRLLPRATLCTPNRFEAEALAEMAIASLADAQVAAERIRALGPRAVLIKGGHLEGPDAIDILAGKDGVRTFAAPRIVGSSPRGTGCTLAAAIAVELGRGADLESAIDRAKQYVAVGIRDAVTLGRGAPFIDHWRAGRGEDASGVGGDGRADDRDPGSEGERRERERR
jgi:hydroxymethylpyrimidine/phosphomethylpyrimidine kinase